MHSTVVVQLPPQLAQQIQRLIKERWFKDANDFIETATRYYLERHTDQMWEDYVEHEIKAGLHAEYQH